MKSKLILTFLILIISSVIFAGELAPIKTEGEKLKKFDNLLIEYTPHRVSDQSKEVYFTKDGFGVGITPKGQFTLNSNKKRLNFIGTSGILAYDKDNPTTLYSLDMKKITKEGFIATCDKLDLTLNMRVISSQIHLGFQGEVTCSSKKNIVLGFAFPIDASTALVTDRQAWVEDFFNAIEGEAGGVYSCPDNLDNSISRYPIGTVLNGELCFSMATGPTQRDSKFVMYKDLRSFVNEYELSFDNNSKEIDFVIYKNQMGWGMRGAYDKYTYIFRDFFPTKDVLKTPTNVVDIYNNNHAFKDLLKYDGYRIKYVLSIEDIYFFKCVAKNKPVYYEIDHENFFKEYPRAVFFGFIPVIDTPTLSENKLIKELKDSYDIIQKANWNPIPMAETKNRNVMTELYLIDKDHYSACFNYTDTRRVSGFVLYSYKGLNKIQNIVDKNNYNIQNQIVDIILDPYQMAMFKY